VTRYFQAHVAGAVHGPFIILPEKDGADQASNGVLVGEDTHDRSAALDLADEALTRRGICVSMQAGLRAAASNLGNVELIFNRGVALIVAAVHSDSWRCSFSLWPLVVILRALSFATLCSQSRAA
jgi:hypothetical protein